MARGGARTVFGIGLLLLAVAGCSTSAQSARRSGDPSAGDRIRQMSATARPTTTDAVGLTDRERSTPCTASQIAVGKKWYGPTKGPGGTIGSRQVYQHLRNVGPTCTFVMPKRVTVSNARGRSRVVRVVVENRVAHRFPAGGNRQISLLATWPYKADKPPLRCGHPVVKPTRLAFPAVSSAVVMHIRGLWQKVCSGPKKRLIEEYFLP